MKEIKFRVFGNNKMINLSGNTLIGRKGENITTRLRFIVEENLIQYNNYIVLTSPSENNYLIDLTNFTYDVKQWITNEIGTWQIEYVSTSQEVDNVENIDESQAILISNTLCLVVEDSNASKELHLEPTIDTEEMETRIENKVDGLVESVDTMSGQIDQLVNTGITVDLTPVMGQLDTLEGLVEQIPTNDYSSDFGALESDLDDIEQKLDNIDVDLTPVTSKLDDIEDKIDLIPTTDNTSNISSIKSTVEAIPTKDYTNDLSSIGGKCDDILTAIQNIGPSATGTAVASDVLSGKTFSNSQSVGINGSMVNNGTVNGSISTKAQSVSIPQGYHDGNGSVSIASAEQAKIIAENIKNGVTILGVQGNYQGGGGASFKFKRLAALFACGETGHSNLEIFDDIIPLCDNPSDTALNDFCSNMTGASASYNQLTTNQFSTILQTVPFSQMTTFTNAFYANGLNIGNLQATINLSSAITTDNMFQYFGVNSKAYPIPTPSQSYLELDFNNTGDNVNSARYMFYNANIKAIKNINCFYRTPQMQWQADDMRIFGELTQYGDFACYVEELTFGNKPLFDEPFNDYPGATLYNATLDLTPCINLDATAMTQTLNSLVAKNSSNVVTIKIASSVFSQLTQAVIDAATNKGYTVVSA